MSMLIPVKIRVCYCFIASSIPLIVNGVNQPFVHRWNNNYRHNSHNNNNINNNNKIFKNFEKLWDDMNTSGRENILEGVKLSKTFPFSKDDLTKQDESNDSIFYNQPRFVQHIDDNAINALKSYYEEVLVQNNDESLVVLDLCSSWISHLPNNFTASKVVGLGMNEEELKANEQLNEYVVQNINVDAALPFGDNTFDFVLNAVSVDYITNPQKVFEEIFRILKPGGVCINSFSNRCFPSKVVNIWLRTNDTQHMAIVGNYFSSTNFTNINAYDISPSPGRSDPLYIVQAVKKKEQEEASENDKKDVVKNNL